MFCPKCGRALLSDAKFCDKCGAVMPELPTPDTQRKPEPVKPGKRAFLHSRKSSKPEKSPKGPKPPRKKVGRKVAAALCVLLLLAALAAGVCWLQSRPKLETVYVLTGCTYLFEEGEDHPYFTCEYENGRPVEWTEGYFHYKATYDEYGNPTRILKRRIDGDKTADRLEFEDDYTAEWEFDYTYDRDGTMLTRDVSIHQKSYSSELEQTYSQRLVWNVRGQLVRIITGDYAGKQVFNGETVTGESDEKKIIDFDYDDQGRLIEESHDGTCFLYSYTRSGALKRVEQSNEGEQDLFTLYYDDQNRLTRIEDYTAGYSLDIPKVWEYSYDRDGNLEAFGGGELTYDGNGNIIHMEHETPMKTGETGREYTYEAVKMTQEEARFYRSWLNVCGKSFLPFHHIRWPFRSLGFGSGDYPSNYLIPHPIHQFPLP